MEMATNQVDVTEFLHMDPEITFAVGDTNLGIISWWFNILCNVLRSQIGLMCCWLIFQHIEAETSHIC